MSTENATPIKRALSLAFGWLADRRVPGFLRVPLYRTWSVFTRSDLGQVLLPLSAFPSLGAFFVRRLVPDARPFSIDPAVFPSPVDGTIQALDDIRSGTVLQAKGRPYPVREMLGDVASELDLEGGSSATIYLAPRDYHRIHCPESAILKEVRWIRGTRHSVNPRVLSARNRVLSINERVVLRLESDRGPYLMVLVGALNVGRIRVVGVEPGGSAPGAGLEFKRGVELARFEMGSTVVLFWPPRAFRIGDHLAPGHSIRMGEALGRWNLDQPAADGSVSSRRPA